jgi:hypothetical protein
LLVVLVFVVVLAVVWYIVVADGDLVGTIAVYVVVVAGSCMGEVDVAVEVEEVVVEIQLASLGSLDCVCHTVTVGGSVEEIVADCTPTVPSPCCLVSVVVLESMPPVVAHQLWRRAIAEVGRYAQVFE